MANYKRIFLNGYSYYITVVTHQRNPTLIDNINLLRESFMASKNKYDFSIESIVVLPDHLHMIITPKYANEYPKIISAIKRHFSRNCDPAHYKHLEQSKSRAKRNMKPIWQKRFYEHTIRDEKDMSEKKRYIFLNPVKHGFVDEPSMWQYSSFGK